ncbi:MAG: tryptophan--tRNA ligase [Anaerolineae bacterium]|nr:tryptophan--tRNA ligase [Thermoflexales bacterium]MDW8406726.1 tryptophan--tRNA ligase [Anaerolineae bacterium]
MSNQTVFSGIQPTGELHLGNYFGAVANWVRIQESGCYQAIYCVVDLHAMTMPYNPNELRKNTQQMFIDLLAAGLDPDKSIVFVQSMVPEHTELAWILGCVCAYGDLTRQTQFKDKSEQLEGKQDAFISAGLFTYPVLQAADILLYRAGWVPVGKDQEQHLELSRDIARRFNGQFGEYFPEPAVLSTETPKLLSLADPLKKMSKSLGPKHYIGLFEEEKSVRAKVRSAVTDTGEAGTEIGPGALNLLGLLRACGKADTAQAFEREYANGARRYAPLKEAVADALVELTGAMRQRREGIAGDRERVHKLMQEGAEKARAIARATMKEVRRLAGLPKHQE